MGPSRLWKDIAMSEAVCQVPDNRLWQNEGKFPNVFSLPLQFPQLEALQLAGRGPRQVGPDIDPARIFPGAGALLDVDPQPFEQALVGRIAVAEHDEGLRLDQAVGILLADDGR